MKKTDISKLKKAGTHGDTEIAHMTKGEVVVPKSVQSPGVMGLLNMAFADQGKDMQNHTVGPKGQRNEKTGLLAFYEDAGDGDNGKGGERSYGGGNTTDGRGTSTGRGWGGGGGDDSAPGSMDQGLLARQGLTSRVASISHFGTNDLGSGDLRARTKDELASYGIDTKNLNSSDLMGAAAPGASMPSASRALGALGTVAGPMGSWGGSILGAIADRAAIQGALSGLGFDSQDSTRAANSYAGSNLAGNMVGRLTGGLIGGPIGSLAGKLASGTISGAMRNSDFGNPSNNSDRMASADSRGYDWSGRNPTIWGV